MGTRKLSLPPHRRRCGSRRKGLRTLTALVAYPLNALRPLVDNPNTMTDDQLARLKASLLTHGLLENLVVQAGTKVVVGGNHRLLALRALVAEGKLPAGLTVPCGEFAFTDGELKRVAVALNDIKGDLGGAALQRFLADQVFNTVDDLLAIGMSAGEWYVLNNLPWPENSPFEQGRPLARSA